MPIHCAQPDDILCFTHNSVIVTFSDSGYALQNILRPVRCCINTIYPLETYLSYSVSGIESILSFLKTIPNNNVDVGLWLLFL